MECGGIAFGEICCYWVRQLLRVRVAAGLVCGRGRHAQVQGGLCAGLVAPKCCLETRQRLRTAQCTRGVLTAVACSVRHKDLVHGRRAIEIFCTRVPNQLWRGSGADPGRASALLTHEKLHPGLPLVGDKTSKQRKRGGEKLPRMSVASSTSARFVCRAHGVSSARRARQSTAAPPAGPPACSRPRVTRTSLQQNAGGRFCGNPNEKTLGNAAARTRTRPRGGRTVRQRVSTLTSPSPPCTYFVQAFRLPHPPVSLRVRKTVLW